MFLGSISTYKTTDCAQFQASAAKDMETALFWAITQRVVAITDVSGQPIGSHLLDS